MKINNLNKLYNKAKNYTEQLKEKYGPKYNEIIEDATEFIEENIPKYKEKAKEVINKTKEKAKNIYDDTHQKYLASQPLKIDILRQKAQKAENEYVNKRIALEKLKMYTLDIKTIKMYEAETKIAELNAQKALQEYEKFKQQQEAVQREFERINNF